MSTSKGLFQTLHRKAEQLLYSNNNNMGRRITWMSEAALVRMQKMHRSDENGDDGGHWSVRHHHHRRLRREMQEKENCCNIGGIEGVTAQLANFQRTWVSLTQGTGLAKAFSRNRDWQRLNQACLPHQPCHFSAVLFDTKQTNNGYDWVYLLRKAMMWNFLQRQRNGPGNGF